MRSSSELPISAALFGELCAARSPRTLVQSGLAGERVARDYTPLVLAGFDVAPGIGCADEVWTVVFAHLSAAAWVPSRYIPLTVVNTTSELWKCGALI